MDFTHYLPSLVSIELCNLPNCNVLPPLSQLSKMKSLALRGLESLEEWNTSYSSGDENVPERLEIYGCPKLRIKPRMPAVVKLLKISNSDGVLSSWGEYTCASITSSCSVDTTLSVQHCKVPMHQWRLLRHLPGLTCLRITACGDLAGSPEIIQHLSSLKSLKLKWRDQEELPKWLGERTSLQKLVISECRGLKELHESMRLLRKLQLLVMYNCGSIASLPHWLGELSSLEKFAMVGCYGIRSLPEGIKQLTNLQELEICNCSGLKRWSESEENKTKVTPNQERACVLPTSIERLVIGGCGGISSLPEGIQQLTNLKALTIASSTALKKWCELEENEAKLAHIKHKIIVDRCYDEFFRSGNW